MNEINSDDIEKTKVTRNKYLDNGINILGMIIAEKDFDYDVFYELSPDAFEKNPGMKFFSLFDNLKKDLEEVLGKTVDLVDTASLAPIGQEGLLSKIHYIDN